MFRLVIDIPLGEDEKWAATVADMTIRLMRHEAIGDGGGGKYRMVRDEDRTPRNYLDKDENGKARTSKLDL